MPNPAPIPPAIDYTNKDYTSFRNAMLNLASYRLPEWTDRSEADPGVLLIELFAYVGDVLAYYQDRLASESFLTTATEPRNILNLLRLIGYQLNPPVASHAELQLMFTAPPPGQSAIVTVPQGAQFSTKAAGGTPALIFEYQGPDLNIDLSKSLTFSPLPVLHSQTVKSETLGSSTGVANQRFTLAQSPVILDSLQVTVDEGAGPVIWNRRANLLYFTANDGSVQVASSNSTDYYVEFDENWTAWVIFGDGVYGRRPKIGANNIRASYGVGGGAPGNVGSGAISAAKTTILNLKSVTNANPAAGGADGESIAHAVRFGPLAFRSGQRAVTLADYVALAQQAGGVAKVRAVSSGWNRVDLYIAPQGNSVTPAPPALKQKLVAFFNDKRMVGTTVTIKDPIEMPVDIDILLFIEHNYNTDLVTQTVRNVLDDMFSFANMDFAQTLFVSKIYEAVEAVPGVSAVNVSRFQRERKIILSGRQLPSPLPSDGRIVAGEFEIPALKILNISVSGDSL